MADYLLHEGGLEDESGEPLLDESGAPLYEEEASRFAKEEADGFLLLETGVAPEVTIGGAVAGGFGPTAAASSTIGGADAGGTTGATVQVALTPGGAIAGGYEPNDNLNPPARVTQVPVETIVYPTTQAARVTQVAVEVLIRPEGPARITQLVLEVATRKTYEDVFLAVID